MIVISHDCVTASHACHMTDTPSHDCDVMSHDNHVTGDSHYSPSFACPSVLRSMFPALMSLCIFLLM